MIAGLQGLPYEEKLRELNLCTLVERRKKFDMVQVFKILGRIDNVDFSSWFTLVGENVVRPTRGTAYAMNLIPSRSNTDIRRNFFSNRVVSTWNSLPTELKKSRTLNIFKTGLEKINIYIIYYVLGTES